MISRAMDRVLVQRMPGTYFPIALLCLSGIALMGLRAQMTGWLLLAAAAVAAGMLQGKDRVRLLLAAVSVGLLGAADINTSTNTLHVVRMGGLLILAAVLPSLVLSKVYHDNVITSNVRPGRRWSRNDILYVVIVVGLAYLTLPVYLSATGSYKNWTVLPGAWNLVILFLCTNALGIWDEMFFDVTMLGIFRRYLPFWWANAGQATLWTSFLYLLGFRGWGPLVLFVFTLLQGYNFKRTGSLAYILTIHVLIDLVLYLALVHLYHPNWVSIFVT